MIENREAEQPIDRDDELDSLVLRWRVEAEFGELPHSCPAAASRAGTGAGGAAPAAAGEGERRKTDDRRRVRFVITVGGECGHGSPASLLRDS